MVTAEERREAIRCVEDLGPSLRRACQLLETSRSSYGYQSRREDPAGLVERIRQLAVAHRRYGYRRIWALLRREGRQVNHKAVHRIWKELGLALPRRRRRKPRHGGGEVPCQAAFVNHVWTYDFVYDWSATGRQLKILTLIDEFSRECLALEPGISITSGAVITVLEDVFAMHGAPKFLRSDNGPEFVAAALQQWLQGRGSQTLYIAPGSPWQNAHGESFNGKLRDECLNAEIFTNKLDAKAKLERYRRFYNYHRPHSSLGYQTPMEFKIFGSAPTTSLFDVCARGLSLWGTPDGQSQIKERQSTRLCPSVCSPALALESLPSVALSSGRAISRLSRKKTKE